MSQLFHSWFVFVHWAGNDHRCRIDMSMHEDTKLHLNSLHDVAVACYNGYDVYAGHEGVCSKKKMSLRFSTMVLPYGHDSPLLCRVLSVGSHTPSIVVVLRPAASKSATKGQTLYY